MCESGPGAGGWWGLLKARGAERGGEEEDQDSHYHSGSRCLLFSPPSSTGCVSVRFWSEVFHAKPENIPASTHPSTPEEREQRRQHPRPRSDSSTAAAGKVSGCGARRAARSRIRVQTTALACRREPWGAVGPPLGRSLWGQTGTHFKGDLQTCLIRAATNQNRAVKGGRIGL